MIRIRRPAVGLALLATCALSASAGNPGSIEVRTVDGPALAGNAMGFPAERRGYSLIQGANGRRRLDDPRIHPAAVMEDSVDAGREQQSRPLSLNSMSCQRSGSPVGIWKSQALKKQTSREPRRASSGASVVTVCCQVGRVVTRSKIRMNASIPSSVVRGITCGMQATEKRSGTSAIPDARSASKNVSRTAAFLIVV